jgi:long-chain fatty acid transport protein
VKALVCALEGGVESPRWPCAAPEKCDQGTESTTKKEEKIMKRKQSVVRVLPALVAGLFSGYAGASGFQLLEQNASGIGNAFAGSAASAEDASTVFWNPAGMTYLPGMQFVVGADAVRPSARFSDSGSIAATGRPRGGNGGDAGDWAGVPFGYLTMQLSPSLAVGVGLSAPFGLATEYDPDWAGRFLAIKSELQTININPSIAWKINDSVSVGFGVNYQRIDAELTRKVNFGLEPLVKIEADDDAWGYNLGAIFQVSPTTRVGVSYRSEIEYDLEGNAAFDFPLNPLNTGVRANVTMPAIFTLSATQRLSDRWEMLGDISWTDWSTLQSLDIFRTNGTLLSREQLKWRDTWRVALGANYKYSDQWKIRMGIAYDQSPVRDATRLPRVPDSDRIWLAVGAQYKLGKASAIDFGYTHIFVKDGSIDANGGVTTIPTNGTLRGNYENSVDILGAQYSMSF